MELQLEMDLEQMEESSRQVYTTRDETTWPVTSHGPANKKETNPRGGWCKGRRQETGGKKPLVDSIRLSFGSQPNCASSASFFSIFHSSSVNWIQWNYHGFFYEFYWSSGQTARDGSQINSIISLNNAGRVNYRLVAWIIDYQLERNWPIHQVLPPPPISPHPRVQFSLGSFVFSSASCRVQIGLNYRLPE